MTIRRGKVGQTGVLKSIRLCKPTADKLASMAKARNVAEAVIIRELITASRRKVTQDDE